MDEEEEHITQDHLHSKVNKNYNLHCCEYNILHNNQSSLLLVINIIGTSNSICKSFSLHRGFKAKV